MIVAFTSLSPAGATFMDWSWHWLKGNDTIWKMNEGWIPLAQDPTTNENAHTHRKNHPEDFPDWHSFVESAKEQDHQNGISFYPVLRSNYGTRLKEYVDNINRLVGTGVQVVVIKKTQEFPYGSWRTGNGDQYDIESFLNENPDIDRTISKKDLRVLVSLRILPQQKDWINKIDKEFGKLSDSVMVINDVDFITDTEKSMMAIFTQQGLRIIDKRLEQWRPIKAKWNENYSKGLKFYENIPSIVEAIVNGIDEDLTQYNLSFFDECVIMGSLMRLQGRRLVLADDFFPKNTKELHKILK